MADLDYSLPLATLLRQGTAVAHDQAAHSEGAGWLVRAELDKEEYVRFLMMLWHVYDGLEHAIDEHASHPTFAPTYNPALLSRTPSLSADISYLLDVSELAWKTHPIHVELISSPPKALADYNARLKELSAATDPSPLLAHAYVRYLGDLSGGQVIRRRIVKAYELDGNDGVRFYEFNKLGEATPGTIGDHSHIKDWFREGMNAAAGEDKALKVAIVNEASTAFALNTSLFTELRRPTIKLATNKLLAPVHPLGDPTSPTISEHPSKENLSEPHSFEVLMDHGPPEETTFTLAGVISFFAAVGLAHFLLITTGFSGADAVDKLYALGVSLRELVLPTHTA